MPVATIPLNALRVPAGKIAVTLDMAGFDPCSIVIAATDLERVVAGVDAMARKTIGPRRAVRTHVLMRESVVLAMRGGSSEDKKGMLMTLLWLALNHPHHGDQLRAAMSEALRRDGKTHLSVTVDPSRTWTFALAEKFVDMTPVMAVLPENTPVSLSIGAAVPDRRMQ